MRIDHEQVKTALLRQYHRWRHLLPQGVVYHPDYFRVQDLLRADPERRRQAIDRRLRHILSTAVTHVPYYRSRVRATAHELAHEPLPALVARFPYISKADVMAGQADFLDERLDTRLLRYATSHGSSGFGIGVWRSKREGDIEKAFYVHEWGRFGFDFRTSRHVRIGYDAVRPLSAAPTWRQGQRLMLSPDHIRPSHRAAILAALRRFRPRYLHAYPSAALALADLFAPGELDLDLRAVLLGSEPAAPPQLAAISRVFGAPVSISYGLTERTNLAFATFQHAQAGAYQFNPLYGWTETRSDHGRSEIVGTSLWNETMPLIRYCTGDAAAIDADGRCVGIEGRLHEFVIDRDGQRLPGLTIALDASAWHFVQACQLYQREPGKVTLRVVPRQAGLTQEQKSALLASPIRYWGRTIDFDCVEVPELPAAPGGKRRFVINDFLLARR